VRRLQLALFRTDGKVHRIGVGTSAPLREPARIRALFAEKLAAIGEDCDPGFGFDVVRLSALATEPQAALQTGLVVPDHAEELAHLIDRLGARFGQHRVARLVPQDTHIPECAASAVPAHEASYLSRRHSEVRADTVGEPRRATAAHPSRAAISVSTRVFNALWRPPQDEGSEHEQDSLAPTRPLRLFVQPEPIEAIAEVPDGPPVRFRWRRVLHEVACAEGPERIAMQWWRDAQGHALTRDYFRVESRDGVRLWLYREGLYEREPGEPRWFLHGLLA
jgi:protein ImuB